MPIYEYECPECGQIFEKIAKISEKETTCSCGNPKAARIMSAFAIKSGSGCGDGSCEHHGVNSSSCGGNCSGCSGCS